MAKSDEFRKYADEAKFWASHSRTDAQRKPFLDMARSWTQAAERCDNPAVVEEVPLAFKQARPGSPALRDQAAAVVISCIH